MQITTSYANTTGYFSRNNDVSHPVNKKSADNTAVGVNAKISETLIKPTGEELISFQEKIKNSAKMFNVRESEIVYDIYSDMDEDTIYNVNGVTFTAKEMKACKEVVKNAIAALPIMGSSLDYRDYASMGIASNMVNSYAKENLTEEQAEVVKKSMEEYMNSLMKAEKWNQDREGCFIDNTDGVGDTGELNTYYNVRSRLSSDAAASFSEYVSSQRNLPEEVKIRLLSNAEHAVKDGAVVQSASNKNLALSIKALFENADLKEPESADNAFKEYQKLMTPVYLANGLRDAAPRVIGADVNKFSVQISNMKAVVGNVGRSLDYSA